MVRFALPGYANNLQVVIKSTALVSILGLVDIIGITQQAGRASQHLFFFNILAALIYLAFTCATLLVLSYVGKRFNVGVKEALLRSEEHTSELQSLMRISYAVFCLKKKTTTDILVIHQH